MTEEKLSEEQAATAARAEKAAYDEKDADQNAPNAPVLSALHPTPEEIAELKALLGVDALEKAMHAMSPTAKPDGATSIAADSIPALIGGLHKRIDELEKAVHELTSHSIMRGIVPAESFLHRWYVKLRGML